MRMIDKNMVKVKASTAHGRNLLNKAKNYEGFFLRDVYGRFSEAKESAWRECFSEYLATAQHDNFRICNSNGFAFSVAWEGIFDGHTITRLETALNSYIIFLDK